MPVPLFMPAKEAVPAGDRVYYPRCSSGGFYNPLQGAPSMFLNFEMVSVETDGKQNVIPINTQIDVPFNPVSGVIPLLDESGNIVGELSEIVFYQAVASLAWREMSANPEKFMGAMAKISPSATYDTGTIVEEGAQQQAAE